MYRPLLFACFFSLIFTSCKQEKESNNIIETTQLEELHQLMQGSFNSEKQALADSTYYNISLHMYPIWKDKGLFLYVEQALSLAQERPYRQRIYELVKVNDSTIASKVYTIPNDSLYIGKWKTPESFNKLTLNDLQLRTGCEVLLNRIEPNYYAGKTGHKTCESTLRGASYATSEVEIWANKIISWDRGFDADGNHIWGAEKGGYIFDKLN